MTGADRPLRCFWVEAISGDSSNVLSVAVRGEGNKGCWLLPDVNEGLRDWRGTVWTCTAASDAELSCLPKPCRRSLKPSSLLQAPAGIKREMRGPCPVGDSETPKTLHLVLGPVGEA